MNASEDVKILFRRFGGEAETYQEIVRDRQAIASLSKWPMLGQVELNKCLTIPDVTYLTKNESRRAMTANAQTQQRPVQAVRPVYAEASLAPAEPFIAVGTPATPSDVKFDNTFAAVKTEEKTELTRPQMETADTAFGSAKAVQITQPLPVKAHHLSAAEINLKNSTPAARAPKQEESSEIHTLSGLFGRLAAPQPQSPKSSALHRKYTK
jgi:hypothetical protein